MATRNHFTMKRNLLPHVNVETGKYYLLFLIILHFTPLLPSPFAPSFSVESLSAGHASPVTWCLKTRMHMVDTGVYEARATSVNPQFLKYHMKWPHILHRCSSQYALGCAVGKIKIVSRTRCACIHYKLASCGVKNNKINHIMNY